MTGYELTLELFADLLRASSRHHRKQIAGESVWRCSSRRDGARIAQRFNAGCPGWQPPLVPEGRLSARASGRSAVPPGLNALAPSPSVETLGYSRAVPP